MQKQGSTPVTNSTTRIEGDYNVNTSLRVLKGLEAVRERLGMYVGDTGTRGLHQLFKEIIDNAIDEVIAGHCTEINVVYGKDGSLLVEDNGRGISVEIFGETGKTGVELVLAEIGHYKKLGFGGYKISGGLHGVGASCVNALSRWLECEVKHDGEIHRMRFERGVFTGLLVVVGNCGKEEHGTKITWLADETIFTHTLDENGRVQYNAERLRNRIRELAYLNKEASLFFHDAQKGMELEVYHSGFKSALTRVINRYARKNGFLQAGDANFAGGTVREGLTAIISVRLPNPQFNSATKDRLDNPELEGMVNRAFGKGISEFFAENPEVAHLIIGKASESAKAGKATVPRKVAAACADAL